jgi:Spy/CpxP family protein refolding chaperone
MIRAIVAVFLFVTPVPAGLAQSPGSDPIAEHVFPPELVMRHAAELRVDERQRAAIKEAVVKAQGRFVDMQFDLQGEAERMVKLLQAHPVDEAAVLAQADKVMGLEREVKKTQLALLVRIKNLLTPAQQEKLSGLRRRGQP